MTQRILILINTIDAGGAETFVMKVFRCLDKHKYIFDFLINKKDSDFYLQEINDLGGKVFYGWAKSKNPIKSFQYIKRVVKENKYSCVFCVAVHPIGWIDLLAARIGGAKKILTRSTNSNAGGIVSRILAKLSRPLIRLLSTHLLAPSKEAGEWLFGRKSVEQNKVTIIANGIDTKDYIYDVQIRQRVRHELKIGENTLVIGHVGRFNRQKNHEKLINIFAEINRRNKDSQLVLVGVGELMSDIQKKVDELGLTGAVSFLGIRNDVPKLLMAFDVFCFPSLYEGMPNAVIEAQAAGVRCVISDTISKDVKITDHLYFVSLNEDDTVWAEKALENEEVERKNSITDIEKAGYSISVTAQTLIEMIGV